MSCDQVSNVISLPISKRNTSNQNATTQEINVCGIGRWKEYRDGSGPTSVAWADDGPLANPALFGGYWVPWRDELGQPFATYR